MLYLQNTKSGKVHRNPPLCSTDPDSENMQEVERLDALPDLDKCSTCFDSSNDESVAA